MIGEWLAFQPACQHCWQPLLYTSLFSVNSCHAYSPCLWLAGWLACCAGTAGVVLPAVITISMLANIDAAFAGEQG
jgi:hypothetical protein